MGVEPTDAGFVKPPLLSVQLPAGGACVPVDASVFKIDGRRRFPYVVFLERIPTISCISNVFIEQKSHRLSTDGV